VQRSRIPSLRFGSPHHFEIRVNLLVLDVANRQITRKQLLPFRQFSHTAALRKLNLIQLAGLFTLIPEILLDVDFSLYFSSS